MKRTILTSSAALAVSCGLVLSSLAGPSSGSVADAAPSAITPSAITSETPAARVATALPSIKPPDNYTPRAGVKFNKPTGTNRKQYRLFGHLNRMINSAPAGSQIRFAVFSFADLNTANNLIRAHRRGVKVKLVFDDHVIYPAMRKLRRALGKNTARASYTVFCKNSCRGGKGEMHAKFYQFSRSGRARFITAIGSNNMTSYNAEKQWSDLVTITEKRHLYHRMALWFRQLARDKPRDRPRMVTFDGRSKVTALPQNIKVHGDPVMRSLGYVHCKIRGPLKRTRLFISAHAWYGPRGYTIAKRVAALSRKGCVVRVIRGKAVGKDIVRVMRKSGVEIRRSHHRGIKTHQKLMIVRGGFEGKDDARLVFTGSHNWSPYGVKLDDLILRTKNRAWVEDYRAQFARMFSTY